MSDERFDRIELRLDRLEHGQQAMRGEIGELRRHMGVLHEEVMDRLKALTFDPEPLRREFRAANPAGRTSL